MQFLIKTKLIRILTSTLITTQKMISNYTLEKTIPGISSYLNVPKESKKVCIYSDSIVKRKDMIDFNDMCKYSSLLKRSFPGCTASQLTHFAKPSLQEDKPDIAIIHVGTNNLTKKNQTEVEIFIEIMDVSPGAKA